MAAVCNKIINLAPAALREKKKLAQDAGLELLGSVSDMFKALELRHHGDSIGSTRVYLSSAIARLRNAQDLLGGVGDLLRSGELSAEAAAWYRVLDYDRLYAEAVAAGHAPASREVWTELVSVLAAGGPVALCDAYRARTGHAISLLSAWLTAAGEVEDPTADGHLVAAQSEMVSLTTYAEYVGYINKLEPLDEQWAVATAGTAAAAA